MLETHRKDRGWLTCGFGLAIVLALGAAPVQAQDTLPWPLGEFQAYSLDSTPLNHEAHGRSAVVWEETVSLDSAAWLRLYFDTVQLGPGSFVRMTSALDGEVQELDAAEMAMWNFSSAYFNGDTVYVELIAGPGTTNNRVVLDSVAVEFTYGSRACGVNECGYCGSDDRVPSYEEWTGRLMPVGCTASVYNTQSCLVSAGHCVDGGWGDVIQFNVPFSLSNCATQNPPVADQFPVTDYDFDNDGPGWDWAVMTTGTNSLGQTAFDRYGVLRQISTGIASPGQTVSVWGYGIDDSPNPTYNSIQQTDTGTVAGRYTRHYSVYVDLTHGNSGGALIRSDKIIGIVTHCPCPNTCTRIDQSDFEVAREAMCGGGFCEAYALDTTHEYISNVTSGTIDNDSGSNSYADYTTDATSMVQGLDYGITVSLTNADASTVGGLWVDWNLDGDFFDPNEAITTSWSGAGPYSTTISVPSWAIISDTRMRVRVQDSDFNGSPSPCDPTEYGEVEDYTISVVEAPTDFDPPSPDPMTFETSPEPYLTPSFLRMVATEAIDAETPPVTYQFVFAGGSPVAADSVWQSSREYIVGGTAANTAYSYTVWARDSEEPANYTAASTPATGWTMCNTPAAPSLGAETASTIDLDVNPGSNPAHTEFAVQCTTSDGAWNGRWVDASGQSSATAVYQTEAAWGTTTVQQLQAETEYCFGVQAINGDGSHVTGQVSNCATTTSSSVSALIDSASSCRLHGGTEVCLSLDVVNVEPRTGGPDLIRFAMDTAVSSVDATVDCVSAGAYTGTVAVTTAGPQVDVALDPALPDVDCCTITLSGDSEDTFAIRILAGDVDRTGGVLGSDMLSVKPYIGQAASPSNAFADVDVNGTVLGSDMLAVKPQIGGVAPTCP